MDGRVLCFNSLQFVETFVLANMCHTSFLNLAAIFNTCSIVVEHGDEGQVD